MIARLLAEDMYARVGGRQVAILDAQGRVAVHTGPEASEWAGHRSGEHFSAQGNILAGAQVADAMAEAFQGTGGQLAHRLMAALEAAQEAGGDRRGQQSAAILVIRKGGGRGYDNDVYCICKWTTIPPPSRSCAACSTCRSEPHEEPSPMLTSKQRAHLRAPANPLKAVQHVGKEGVTDSSLTAVMEAFAHRELIKVKVQEASPQTVREAADAFVAGLPGVQYVQTIGRSVVLYRRHPEKPKIVLP